jgi:hypothetical protein
MLNVKNNFKDMLTHRRGSFTWARWLKTIKTIKGTLTAQRTTTVWRFRAERPPFSQIAKVILR